MSGEQTTPFFSICIPQYSRYDYLKAQCQRLAEQSWKDFEVCIADDLSPERRWDEMRDFIERSGLRCVYRVNERNLRYDGNLRAAIGLATGQYVMLMGNDDRLAAVETLTELHRAIRAHDMPEVIVTNYRVISDGKVYRRVRQTHLHYGGIGTAVAWFRNYSFVSGLLFDRKTCEREASSVVDGSEMYQMFLGTRIIAKGGRLLALDQLAVEKDIRIAGGQVDSYATRPIQRARWWSFEPRKLPLRRYAAVAVEAVRPVVSGSDLRRFGYRVILETYIFSFAFWLLEFRRTLGWRYAAEVGVGMRPSIVTQDIPLSRLSQQAIAGVYFAVMLVGLTMPIALFDWLRPHLYSFAKHAQRVSSSSTPRSGESMAA